MRNEIESFTVGTKTVKIMTDENPESPRHDSNLGVMVAFHRRYDLGDKGHGVRADDFNGWDEMEAHLRKEKDAALILPLYLYDHSGITMSTKPFSCPWDSGRLGLIYVTKAKLREEYGVKRLGAATLRKATAVLEGEVETYDQYLRGDVYGYAVEDEGGNVLDSCWGFYGLDYCREEAKGAA
jgi:hypothetical protein